MRGKKHLLKLIWRHYVEHGSLGRLLKHFQPEYQSFGSQVHPLLWIVLDAIREEADHPIFITSHFRPNSSTTHGGLESGVPPAVGVDIRCWHSRPRYHLIRAAYSIGVTRIGQYCDDGHIHIDIGDLINPEEWPSEVHWLPKPRRQDE